MHKYGPIFVGVLVMAAGGGCARTKFKSSWSDPTAAPTEFSGKRVAVFAVTKEARRHGAEDRLAQELTKRGVLAVPGYKLVKDGRVPDPAALRSLLRSQNMEGAVIMEVVARRDESHYLPTYVPGGPNYAPFDVYGADSWNSVFGPGYVATTTTVSVETRVYSVAEQKLLWKGVSETFQPVRIDYVIKNSADEAAKEITKAGLIR